MSDRVVVAAHGRDGFEERTTHGLALRRRKRLLLPAQDGGCRNAEGQGRLVGRQGKQRLDPEDAEAGLGREVGSLAFRDLVPAGGQDLEGLAQERCVQRLLLQLCEAVEHGVARVAVVADALCEGESEEVRGFHEGAERQAVEQAPLHGGPQQAVEVVGGHVGTRLSRGEITRGGARLSALARRWRRRRPAQRAGRGRAVRLLACGLSAGPTVACSGNLASARQASRRPAARWPDLAQPQP